MNERDRIAAIVLDVLNDASVHNLRWRTSVSGIIANRLIAAGVTMPSPPERTPDWVNL